jgi:hypothetical protein
LPGMPVCFDHSGKTGTLRQKAVRGWIKMQVSYTLIFIDR